MVSPVALAGVLALALQVTGTPRIIGPAASRITTGDVTAIARVIVADGAAPWLLDVRPPVGLPDIGRWGKWTARGLLPPDVQAAQLRRGRVVTVVNESHPAAPRPAEWNLAERQSVDGWAQVALPGHAFEDVQDESDLNMPFYVSGAFTDEELVGIVEFIRSRPELPPLPRYLSAGGKVSPEFGPITTVARDDRGIRVSMRRGGDSRQCNGNDGGFEGSDLVWMEYRSSQWTGAYDWSCLQI